MRRFVCMFLVIIIIFSISTASIVSADEIPQSISGGLQSFNTQSSHNSAKVIADEILARTVGYMVIDSRAKDTSLYRIDVDKDGTKDLLYRCTSKEWGREFWVIIPVNGKCEVYYIPYSTGAAGAYEVKFSTTRNEIIVIEAYSSAAWGMRRYSSLWNGSIAEMTYSSSYDGNKFEDTYECYLDGMKADKEEYDNFVNDLGLVDLPGEETEPGYSFSNTILPEVYEILSVNPMATEVSYGDLDDDGKEEGIILHDNLMFEVLSALQDEDADISNELLNRNCGIILNADNNGKTIVEFYDANTIRLMKKYPALLRNQGVYVSDICRPPMGPIVGGMGSWGTIPRINIDSIDANRMNDEIWSNSEYCISAIRNNDELNIDCSYRWYQKGNLLSVLYLLGMEYYVYNINISTGVEAKNKQIYTAFSLNEEQFKAHARCALGSALLDNSGFWGNYSEDELTKSLNDTTSDENVSQCKLFINNEGHLGLLGTVLLSNSFGETPMTVIIDLSTYTPSDNLPQELLPGTKVPEEFVEEQSEIQLSERKYDIECEEDRIVIFTALAKLSYSEFSGVFERLYGKRFTKESGNEKMFLSKSEEGMKVSEIADSHLYREASIVGGIWDNKNIEYSDFYRGVIGDYSVVSVLDKNKDSGLYAICLRSPDDQYVISYRGSEMGDGQFAKDWVETDGAMAVLNKLSFQFEDATRYYYDILDYYCEGDSTRLTLTGHSLGGALAAYVSIRTGAAAYTSDGAVGHVIDSAFIDYSHVLAAYKGRESFNFVNYTDQGNQVVSNLIQRTNTSYVPTKIMESEYKSIVEWQDYFRLNSTFWGAHHALSTIMYDEEIEKFCPRPGKYLELEKGIWEIISLLNGTVVVLGDSGDDSYSAAHRLTGDMIDIANVWNFCKYYIYGGEGNNTLRGSFRSDVLQTSGCENHLYGGLGNDTYLVNRRENGTTTIVDPSGNDIVYLVGWPVDEFDSAISSITKENNALIVSFSDSEQKIKISLQRKNNWHEIGLALMSDEGVVQFVNYSQYGINLSAGNEEQRVYFLSNREPVEENDVIRQVILPGCTEVEVYNGRGERIKTLSNYPDSTLVVVDEFPGVAIIMDGYIDLTLFDADTNLVIKGDVTVQPYVFLYSEKSEAVESFVYAEEVDLSKGDVAISSMVNKEQNIYYADPSSGDVISVKKQICVSSVEIEADETDMNVGQTLQLTANVSPTNATNSTITWISADPSIAEVDATGKVTAISAGKVLIIASSADGTSMNDSLIVTVKNEHAKIENHDTKTQISYAEKFAAIGIFVLILYIEETVSKRRRS